MGARARLRPERLAEKLLQIRMTLGLSQNELIRQLGVEDLIGQNRISSYEVGSNEPPLPILLRYSRLVKVPLDVLADDELDLPRQLPSRSRADGSRRPTASRSKAKR